MKPMPLSALVNALIDITYSKNQITHKERFFASALNCWRDAFPGSPLERAIQEFQHGNASPFTMDIKPGILLDLFNTKKVYNLSRNSLSHKNMYPFKSGRFYPQGKLNGIPGVFKENIQPFRCVDINPEHIQADLNHPMAGIGFQLEIQIENAATKPHERGGACTDWLETALSGPGMQTRYNGTPSDFFSETAFERSHPGPDEIFYRTDRFVHHIDQTASQNLSEIYRRFVQPGKRVLDLMAGWESHMPDDIKELSVHGLGLNKAELEHNSRLSAHTVQDLNASPVLAFDDSTFDTVLCSLSVEYLIHPEKVFKEVARILKPGGWFAVSFSNRWFPEKAIRIWQDLHEFERMGMVIEYFLASGMFDTIETQSVRGYPRPENDKYYPGIRESDPLYVVMGRCARRDG